MGNREDHAGSEKAEKPENGPRPASCPVVGIGASAGGLEALKVFFEVMPADGGIAFVVVLHLDPHRQSIMRDLLARYTTMPVVEAQNGMPLEPNYVYVITPDTFIVIHDGQLFLEPSVTRRGRRMPADLLFRSIAEARGERAIGIVLSGTGSEGASGLKEIKGAGGMTIVQKPDTALFDGMPRAALTTGAVDLVLAIQ